MRRGVSHFLLVLMLGLLSGDPSRAGHSEQADQSQDDRWLEETVQRVLEQRGYKSVGVQSDNGVVILTGEVRSARDKVLAIQAVFEIAEVQAIESDLRLRNSVTPELEEEIWLTLVEEGLDSGLEDILVENGVASVSGRVANEETRSKIFRAVRNVPGVTAVTSALIVASAETMAPSSEPAREAPPAPAPAPTAQAEPTPAPRAPEPVPEEEMPETTPPAASEPEPEPAPVLAEVEAAPEPATPPAPPQPAAQPQPAPNPPAPERPLRPPGRPEAEIARDVAEQILASNYTVFDHVRFGFESGIVSLSGFVTSSDKKEILETGIASVSGVASVRNDIRVLSSSSADDRLRKTLFRRIYEEPAFAEFAELPNPPVHIIVDAKHVTLTGVVETLIQQMAAEAIVRSTFGVRSVNNQLRIVEE